MHVNLLKISYKFSKISKSGFESVTKPNESSKLRLNVPSILVETQKKSEVSLVSLASSLSQSDRDDSTSSLSEFKPMIDIETLSMILRNVEELEKLEKSQEESNCLTTTESFDVATSSKIEENSEKHKKHFIFRDLKLKLHHLSETLKRHDSVIKKKTPSEVSQHGKLHNVSDKLHQIAEKVHNFHLPHLHHQQQHEPSLVGQAVQTMLMENFNIAEATTEIHIKESSVPNEEKKSSSLESFKRKLSVFGRKKSEQSKTEEVQTTTLQSIEEVKTPRTSESEKTSDDLSIDSQANSSSTDSLITVVPNNRKFSSFSDSMAQCSFQLPRVSSADTNINKMPLHESLLSLTRNDLLLSASPNGLKTHTRTESTGAKFSASPQRISSSLGKDQGLSSIHRRSSDSDLSITPKGELTFSYSTLRLEELFTCLNRIDILLWIQLLVTSVIQLEL